MQTTADSPSAGRCTRAASHQSRRAAGRGGGGGRSSFTWHPGSYKPFKKTEARPCSKILINVGFPETASRWPKSSYTHTPTPSQTCCPSLSLTCCYCYLLPAISATRYLLFFYLLFDTCHQPSLSILSCPSVSLDLNLSHNHPSSSQSFVASAAGGIHSSISKDEGSGGTDEVIADTKAPAGLSCSAGFLSSESSLLPWMASCCKSCCQSFAFSRDRFLQSALLAASLSAKAAGMTFCNCGCLAFFSRGRLPKPGWPALEAMVARPPTLSNLCHVRGPRLLQRHRAHGSLEVDLGSSRYRNPCHP